MAVAVTMGEFVVVAVKQVQVVGVIAMLVMAADADVVFNNRSMVIH